MKRIKQSIVWILVVLFFVQSPLVYAQELATPSATFDNKEATPSMILDQLEATDSASTSALVDISVSSLSAGLISPTPTLEMLTGPSGVLSPSASIKGPPHIRPMTKHTLRAGEVASVIVENVDESALKVTLKNSSGVSIESTPSVEPYDGGIRVMFIPKTSFKPGKYTIVVEDTTTGTTVTQDFLWGVLAFNTDQAVYAPGDTAAIALAVLDENGSMVCNADVTLTILSPTRKTTTLTTADGSIRVTRACLLHNFTLEPDYETTFQTSDEGVYQVLLSATTKNGSYSIQDSFQVSSDMPFGVKRTSATRIYPPKAYPMTIDVTANEDFSGTVTETVPESFTITPLDGTLQYTDVKTVVPDTETHTPILLGMPFEGNYPVTLGFGDRIKDPQVKSLYEQNGLQGHDGADFAMPEGTQVLAADIGTVSRVADNPYGTTVVIDHSWGRSYYGHVSVVQVKVGDVVAKGAPIALSGNTGLTIGAHLHFGMKLTKNDMNNGYYGKIDPMPYLTSSVIYQADGSGKQISWNVDIKTGEKIRLGYTYKAPVVSPQFYLIGPLTFRATRDVVSTPTATPDNPFVLGTATESASLAPISKNNLIYQEPRRWQLAVDAVAYRGGYNDGGAANPTSGTWSLTGTNAVAGDFAITVWYSRASTKTITPTGPTLITNNDQSTANGGHIWVGYKVITATDITNGNVGTWTASSVTNGTTGSSVAVFSGVDTSAAITHYATATAGGTGDPDPPSISTTSGNTLITIFGEMDQNDGVTAPTNFTLATNAGWSTTSGTDGSSDIAYYLAGGTGSSYDPAVFTTVTDSYWYATTLEITHEDSPTVALNTPTDTQTITDTTPDLVFTGTDLNSDEIEYNVQVDTVNTFDSISVGFNLKYVDVWLGKQGAPTDNVTLEIRSTIDGAAIGTSGAISATTITTAGGYVLFTFATPISLTLNTKYYMVLKRSGARDTTNYIKVYCYVLNAYSGGGMYTNNSNVWTSEDATDDLRMIIYDTENTAIITQNVGGYFTYLYGGTGTYQEQGQSFTAIAYTSLLNVNSVDNPGFAGTGDPHPWPSGNAVTYTLNTKVVDNYSVSEWSGGSTSLNPGAFAGVGQSFNGKSGTLNSVSFYLEKVGSPTDYAVAKIYEMSGTYGNGDNIPTGAALATSDNFAVSTLLTTSYMMASFTFSGGNKITLTADHKYVATIEYSGGVSNYIQVARDATAATHSGNYSTLNVSTWTAQAGLDGIFGVYIDYVLPEDTYYWRVRGLDPLGSNAYGAWSSPTWSFTVGSTGPTNDQLMRHGMWFSSGVKQGFTF